MLPFPCVQCNNVFMDPVPHTTAYVQYYRRMRDYYQDLCRPPLSVHHEPAAASPSSAAAPRFTEHTKGLHAEHLEAGGMVGFDEAWQPKRPSKYLKQIAIRERAKALTENGLHSERVKKLNEKAIAQRQAIAERQQADSESRKMAKAKVS